MNANRAITLLSLAAILAGLGLAMREAWIANGLRAALALVLTDENSLRDQVHQADRRREQLAADLAEARENLAKERLQLLRDQMERAAATGELHAIDVRKAAIASTDRPFFDKLGLPPDKIEQAEKFMAEFRQQMIDLAMAAARQGIAWSDPALNQMRQSVLDQLNGRMEPLLGADGFAQYQQFQRVESAGVIVTGIAGEAFHSGAPLTAAQGDQLIQIIANASPDYQSGGEVNPNNVDWNAVQAQAQRIFPAQQFSALQGALADRQSRFQLQQLTRALTASAP